MPYLFVLLLIVIIDQVTKYYIAINFELNKSLNVLNDFLYLTYIKNAGASFGILQNYQMLFIIITSIILIVLLGYFIITPKDNILLRTSLTLIIAGGLGNLIDRIRLGYVVDFIDIRVWPIFNIADSAVVIGTILLAYYIIFKYK